MVDDNTSNWAIGSAYFASLMLMVAGFFQVIVGVAAIVKDDFYVSTQDWVFTMDVTTWGWVHLVLGLVLGISGVGILTGNVAARTVGVVVASLSAVANFAFLPWYPIWAIVVIAADVTIIWALTAHGRDVETVNAGGGSRSSGSAVRGT